MTNLDKLTNRLWLRVTVLFGSHSGSICRWMSYLQVQVDITATQRASPVSLHSEQANLGT